MLALVGTRVAEIILEYTAISAMLRSHSDED
jgi:hypothetical protein